jgi:lipoate---protein ligase
MMNFLQLDKMPIFEMLQLEEALLRVGEGNWCLINRGSPPAIVMGISGKEEELLHADEVQRQQIPVIRRFSGGGTVVIDEETLFVTFIGDHNLATPYPEPILRFVSDHYAKPIAAWENDLIIGDRKCGGNAQYIRKNRWLHHTSLLWDYSPTRMQTLKHPKRTPKYRAGRDHTDFICRLRDHFPSPDQFLQSLRSTLSERNPLTERSLDEVLPILLSPHRQATRRC